MAADEYLLERIRNIMNDKSVIFSEKKMFGGVCFMVDEKMCFGPGSNGLMARVNPDEIDDLASKDGADYMMHGGKPFKGYLMIDHDAIDMEDDLEFWIQKCLDFNPLAKSSQKK